MTMLQKIKNILDICSTILTKPSYKHYPMIGFLMTDFNFHYDNVKRHTHNYPSSRLVYDALVRYNFKIKIIDYTHIITAETLDMEFLDIDEGKKTANIDQIVFEIVKAYLERYNIKKVIIPGYYYNWQHNPYPLTPNREWITRALTKLADMGEIHLMGICGGMQGILHAHKIKLAKVSELVGRENAKPHTGFLDDIRRVRIADVSKAFNQSLINPDSKLAKITLPHTTGLNSDGWLGITVFELHGIAVDNDIDNLARLQELGYKVIMRSNDDIIEGVEDTHGNMHFQFHPDYALHYGNSDNTIENVTPQTQENALKFAEIIFKEFIER